MSLTTGARYAAQKLDKIRFDCAVKIFAEFDELTKGLTGVYPLDYAFSDDGAFALEWIFSDRRLGITLETNFEDSGWFLIILDGENIKTYDYGLLEALDLSNLVSNIVNKI